MPAIPPLTGLGGLNPSGGAPVSIPAVGYQGAAPAVINQLAIGSTSVSGPTTYTLTFTTASLPGSTLVVFVAVNASAAAALGATPAGWTLLFSQVTATLALGCYVFYNNPGAITTFTLSSPTATLGGISGLGYELLNCPFISDVNQNQNATSTSAASGASQLQPPATNNIVLGAIAWVLGAATLANNSTVPAGSISNNPTTTASTNGTTNASLRGYVVFQPAMVSGASTGFIISGTLSASSQWCAGALSLRSLASDYSVGSSDQNAEYPGFSIIAGGQQAISVGRL